VLDNQKKFMGELQLLNDMTQQDMIKVNKELHKRKQEKQDIQLKYYDQD
jgi:hypothetical protein